VANVGGDRVCSWETDRSCTPQPHLSTRGALVDRRRGRLLRFSFAEWACGAVGSAREWHSRGRRFDPGQVHQSFLDSPFLQQQAVEPACCHSSKRLAVPFESGWDHEPLELLLLRDPGLVPRLAGVRDQVLGEAEEPINIPLLALRIVALRSRDGPLLVQPRHLAPVDLRRHLLPVNMGLLRAGPALPRARLCASPPARRMHGPLPLLPPAV
jgi:hypothetical protein